MGEGKSALARGQSKFLTPSSRRNEHKKRITVDDLTMFVIRRKIYDFYINKTSTNKL